MFSANRFLRIFSLLIGLAILLYLALPSGSQSSMNMIKETGYLLWGSDAEGGAPYAFPDPHHPSRLVGFEVDIADAIARELGVEARRAQNAWDSLIPALQRGDFDFAMNGIEITPQRSGNILFSKDKHVNCILHP